jgi:hypothetical protein
MPASRWNSNLLDEILEWMEDDELTLTDLILNPIVTRMVDDEKVDDSSKGDVEPGPRGTSYFAIAWFGGLP